MQKTITSRAIVAPISSTMTDMIPITTAAVLPLVELLELEGRATLLDTVGEGVNGGAFAAVERVSIVGDAWSGCSVEDIVMSETSGVIVEPPKLVLITTVALWG